MNPRGDSNPIEGGATSSIIGIIVAVIVLGAVLVPICNGMVGNDNGGSGGGGGGDNPPVEPTVLNSLSDVYAELGGTFDFKSYQCYDIETGVNTPMMSEDFPNVSELTESWDLTDIQDWESKIDLSNDFYWVELMTAWAFVDGVNWALEIKYMTYDDGMGGTGILVQGRDLNETYWYAPLSSISVFSLSVTEGNISLSCTYYDENVLETKTISETVAVSYVRGITFVSDEEDGWIKTEGYLYDEVADDEVYPSVYVNVGSELAVGIDLLLNYGGAEMLVTPRPVITIEGIEDGWLTGQCTIEDYAYYAYGNPRVTGLDMVLDFRLPATQADNGNYIVDINWWPDGDDDYVGVGYWDVVSYDYDYFVNGTIDSIDVRSVTVNWVSTMTGSSEIVSGDIPVASRSVATEDGNQGGNSVTDTLIQVIPVFVAIAIILAVVGLFYQGREQY